MYENEITWKTVNIANHILIISCSYYKYFHSLPLEVQKKIEESDVNSFADMQQIAEKIKSEQTQK